MIEYELKGRVFDDSSAWRVTYRQNTVQHGWARKLGRQALDDEVALIQLQMEGPRGGHQQEDRRRKVLWRARTRLEAIIRVADEDERRQELVRERLPLVIRFSAGEEARSRAGYLARLVDVELARLAEACGLAEGGALPRPPKDPKVSEEAMASSSSHGLRRRHHQSLPRLVCGVMQKYGTRTWMGVAVPHVDDTAPVSVQVSRGCFRAGWDSCF